MAELSAPISEETTRPLGIVAARMRQFLTPTAIVSLILALILIFLVANPLLQLVKESLTSARTGDYTFAQLRRGVRAAALRAGLYQFAAAWRLRRGRRRR